MRHNIYNILVNRQFGISIRYHKLHDGSKGAVKVLSWIYLLWLNFAYYVLQIRFLGHVPEMDAYESKKLNVKLSESEEHLKKSTGLSVDEYMKKLSGYDVISFDVFDTLIFRPLSLPTDVFYMIGNELGIMDFRNKREWAEWDARMKCNTKEGNMEITLSDIWDNLQKNVGISSETGQMIESEIEIKLCYANPFMLEVWKRLKMADKRIIIVSDMYLPKKTIVQILEKSGFVGADKIYISNEYHRSKADGRLFKKVIYDIFGAYPDAGIKPGHNILYDCGKERKNPNGYSMVHVGDNPHSDIDMARAYGLDVMPYQNVNKNMMLYRAFDMSSMVGSAYRAIVSNWLYSGLRKFSMEYEYGFIYGGLFVLGYCTFIHDYCEMNNIDKVLFLSRDGDILKQVYNYLYPNESTEYVYWSRKAATKLMFNVDKHDYFRRFIFHKINQNYSIAEILKPMELEFLTDELVELKSDDKLTDKNGYLLRQFIEEKWDKVKDAYAEEQKAAKAYYNDVLKDCSRVAAVDIGWAGSGAMALSYLVEKEWKFPCKLVGIIAGTNTVHNVESDASEPFLQSGKLVSYMYSQRHNRDLWKKHNPDRNYNVFWELLLSSPTPQFTGFGLKRNEDDKVTDEIELHFGKYDKNQEGIEEIQKGILDFVESYKEQFKDFSYMMNISGRDAYAPMLLATSHHEKYLKAITKKFALEINI